MIKPLSLGERRPSATLNPDAAWASEQASMFVKRARDDGLRVHDVRHDRDGKYGKVFDATLRKQRAQGITGPPKAPITQAFVEQM